MLLLLLGLLLAAPPIEAAEVLEDREAFLVLDVRTPQEFQEGRVPGAWNVPVDELAARAEEVRTRAGTKTIVIYCKSGKRSARALDILEDAKVDGRHLTGDYLQWVADGRTVETGKTPTPVPTERGREKRD